MKRHFIHLTLILLCIIPIHAQKSVFLNQKSEIIKEKSQASQYAVITKNKDSNIYTIDFYSMDSVLLRTSEYAEFGKTPNKQVLYGKTSYKFPHSQQDSLVCYYRNNLRIGGATFYYPDGKKHVECSYKQGLLSGLLFQYYPNDSIKRKDIYEKGVATTTIIYSEEGEIIGNSPFYVAPTPIDSDINSIIRELAEEIEVPRWNKAGVWEAYIEITFDSEGKQEDIKIIQSNHQDLTKSSIKAATKVFQDKVFTPATMDRKCVRGSIILPLRYRVESSIRIIPK